MKKGVPVVCLCLLFLFVGTASAQMYVGVKGGFTKVKDADMTVVEDVDVPPVFDTEVRMQIAEPVVTSIETLTEIDFDNGWIFGAAVGTTLNNFRVEGEFEYRTSDFTLMDEEDTLKTISLMANGYYDFNNDSAFTPFVGAGVGWARHDVDDANWDDSGFAYQGTIGVAWGFRDSMNLDLAYRYFTTIDPEFENTEIDYASHNITAGLRFSF